MSKRTSLFGTDQPAEPNTKKNPELQVTPQEAVAYADAILLDIDEAKAAIQWCQDSLKANPDNAYAYFILVHALLAAGETRSDTESATIDSSLEQVDWGPRKPIYNHWFQGVETLREIDSPKISALVVSNRHSRPTEGSLIAIREQMEGLGEILLVQSDIDEKESEKFSSLVDKIINLGPYAGVFMAFNIGVAFAKAPVVLFLDGVGMPSAGFVQRHLDAHRKFEPLSVQGRSEWSSEADIGPASGDLGDDPTNTPVVAEFNSSYLRSEFCRAGGWGDYILFGSAGLKLSNRLLELDKKRERQIYAPKAVLQYNAKREDEARAKTETVRNESNMLLLARAPEVGTLLSEWFSSEDNKDDTPPSTSKCKTAQTKPTSVVLRAGNWNNLKNNALYVDWVLSRKCNYSCSYCTVHNNQSPDAPLSQVKAVIDKLAMLPKDKVTLSLTGGEPTVYPHFVELIEHAVNILGARLSITVQTNIGLKLKYFEKMADRLGEGLKNINFLASFHPEHAKKDEYFEKIEFLNSKGATCTIKILADPTRIPFIKELYEEALTLVRPGIRVELVVIRQDYGVHPDRRYKPDDLEWVNSFSKTKKKGGILYESLNLETGELKKEHFSSNELIIADKQKFKGMVCNAGVDKLSILVDGSLDSAVCFRPLQKIKDNVFSDPDSILKYKYPVICPFEYCYVPGDQGLPKCHPSFLLQHFSGNQKPSILDVYPDAELIPQMMRLPSPKDLARDISSNDLNPALEKLFFFYTSIADIRDSQDTTPEQIYNGLVLAREGSEEAK